MPPKQLGATLRADYKDRLKVATHAIQVAVQLHGPRVVASVIAATTPPPVDRGTYRRTWYVEDLDEGVVLYNNSPHAPIIEAGRRKGAKMPPVGLIAEWVRRKGIASREEAKGIGFVIARSIARRGLPGKWVLKRSQKLLDPLVLQAVAQSAKIRPPVKPRKS